MIKKFAFLLLSFLFFYSCQPAGQEEEAVTVETEGVFEPITIEVVDGEDRGEFLIGSDPDFITVKVKNNSKFTYKGISLVIDEDSDAGVKFSPDAEGLSSSPGLGGTCKKELPPGKQCTYILKYDPTLPGESFQKLTFNYKDLVDAKNKVFNLRFLAGEAASLIFDGEQINYTFGVIERTERTKYTKLLNIKNTGGLSAKNIVFSKIDVPNTSAYKVLSNNCPSDMIPGQECQLLVQFEPQNYGIPAPDGNIDLTYTSNLKFDYIRDPEGGVSALNAYFSTISTTIEAKIKASGVESIEFDGIVVGNITDKNVKIQNQGYKEGILQSVDVRDGGNNLVARCISTGGASLECRDPSDINNPGAVLPLTTLPFKIVDINNCTANVDDLGYSRAANGAISIPSVRTIFGKTTENSGEACFFNVKFHPSVTFTSDGNFNNYRLNFRFDSTWKNNIVLYNDKDTDSNTFTISEAEYYSAAKLDFILFEYANNEITNEDADDDGNYVYDLGRVSLVSSTAYSERLRMRMRNIGTETAEIVSITDGASSPFTFTDTSTDINTYYKNAAHVNCTFVSAQGQCDIQMELNPLASTNPDSTAAQAEENGFMYDILNTYPDRYKVFKVKYKDGTTYNDDMSARQPLELEVSVRSLLVRKGFLVYEDVNMNQGNSQPIGVAGNTDFFYLKIKNVGTGGITYIDIPPEINLVGLPNAPVRGNAYPFNVVDEPGFTGMAGADLDCYDLIDLNSMSGPPGVTPGTNAPSILDPGMSCSLTIEHKLNNSNKKIAYTATEEWLRFFDLERDFTDEAREFEEHNNQTVPIYFSYYDGDGIASPATNYTPSLAGHGNLYTLQEYRISKRMRTQANLVPISPLPMISAILYRPSINLVPYAPNPNPIDEPGSPIPGGTIAEMWKDSTDSTGAAPAAYAVSLSNGSRLHVNNNHKDSTYEYVFHAGTFRAGQTYRLSFNLRNAGDFSATSISESLTGDSEISLVSTIPSVVGPGAQRLVSFDFTPTTSGTFEADYVVDYTNQRRFLVDRTNLIYTNDTPSIRIKVIAEAVPSTDGYLSLTSQNYIVTYDSVGDSYTEVIDGASTTNYNLLYNDTDTGESALFKAIRGSKLYAKKIFTVRNEGNSTLENLTFYIKKAINASTTSNSASGEGYSITSNGCNNVSLGPGGTCTFEVRLLASVSEPATNIKYGFISYSNATNQFISEGFRFQFVAADPAKLKVGTINPVNITDENSNVISDSYGLSYGFYTDASHPTLSGYPTNSMTKTYNVANESAEKASFLAQYRAFVGNPAAILPAGAWHVIFNDKGIQVEGSRGCFNGDDEGSGLDMDKWGFNNTTAATCTLRVTYTFDETYVGEKVPEAQSYAQLSFYDNERASSSVLTVHVKGFVEANRSTAADAFINNVTATSDGDVSFSWTAYAPQNASWGTIDGYRVYYSPISSVFDNIFEATGVNFVDTTDPNVVVTGLVPGKYYYFYVTAKRTTPNGKEYISINPNATVHELVVPPVGTIYDYFTRTIIDKFQSPEGDPVFGGKNLAVATCQSEIQVLSKNGANINKAKKLIDTQLYNLIDSDEAGNSDYSYKAIPHWINDDAVDIEFAGIFPDFSCTEQNGYDGDNTFYQKPCGDCSCNELFKVIGGDGGEIPYAATLYVEDTFIGGARCYVDQ